MERRRGNPIACCRARAVADALWHFLDSPLRRDWSAFARSRGQQEVWALNLPRLSRQAAGPPDDFESGVLAAPAERAVDDIGVGLELSVDAPGRATLRLT